MIGKLSTIMVVVKDMKRSTRFYRDVLGLKLSYGTPHWTQLEAGNISLGLHPEGKETKVSPSIGCTFGFEVNDIRTTVAELKKKGAQVAMEPRKEDFGWLAMVTDPDGYYVQLYQPAEHSHGA